jgi:UDP-N-acetylglucosamine 4,6-dehydratase/5-epimerase
MDFKNKSLLITGGTGSFGHNFVKYIIKKKIKLKKLIIFSRDEYKQYKMSQTFSEEKYPFLRYFLGDIRDLNRLTNAVKNLDYVVHAAALKQVPTAEYNPEEFIKTNIIGTQNLINACLESSVNKIISLSTDKAVSPANLYGATKLCADKLIMAANHIKGNKKISFSAVRYGNVFGSRGSVVPLFMKQKEKNILTLTNSEMTRFSILYDDAIEMVLWAIQNAKGGEIIVPKIPSYRILDLAKTIAPKAKIKTVGIRQGEKIHEELINENDGNEIYENNKYYIIVSRNKYLKIKYDNKVIKRVKKKIKLNSLENKFLNISELKKMLKKL